jgi:uncharacterized protein YndB with AHSA1/START domain
MDGTGPRMARWAGMVEADVRPGGRYRFESDAGDGKTFVFAGEYLALEPGHSVKQAFLAGEAGTPSPYLNEFIEIRLRELPDGRTELAFLNSWDGEALGEAAKAGWNQWLDMMEASLATTG